MSFVPEAPAQADADMIFPGRHWDVATPESQGVHPARFAAALAFLEAECGEDGISEVVVIRNGRMIHEGPHAGSEHMIWSATKSFGSIATGMLIDDGKLALDTKLADILPIYAEHYPEVTVRHCLTLTDGFGGHEVKPPFAPKPPNYAPGTAFHYAPGLDALARVATAAAGEEIENMVKRRLEPLNMERWFWGTHGVLDDDHVNGFGGGPPSGVQMNARTIAKVGHMLLNQGNWDGEQILSAEYIAEATRNQADHSVPMHDPDGWYTPIVDSYGYAFWVNGIKRDGKRLFPNAPDGMFALQGNLNNFCIIIPEWNMVFVRLGTDKIVGHGVWDEFFGYLAKAVE